ncbi:hypothetical protein ACH5RR_033750 [Cinchona calisaya]|uniref:Uncharacterized protein n=1 Tax=Cinchona calisaya TaxID=153742 RepID=A0ABD2Y8V3_9GENT
MATLPFVTGGQRHSYAPKFFASVVNVAILVLPLKNPSVYRGEPPLFFSIEEVALFSKPLKHALASIFARGKPRINGLRKNFSSVGFQGPLAFGLIDYHYVFIHFDLQVDYDRCWIGGFYSLGDLQCEF